MPVLGRFPAIEFHQFQSETDEDRLIVFAAPASVLAQWAGIPRKGWRLRALYQRWVTPNREREVTQFWNDAARYKEGTGRFLLGPTALTLAASEPFVLEDGEIVLSYDNPLLSIEGDTARLKEVASRALPAFMGRLNASEQAQVELFREEDELPDESYDQNHVMTTVVAIAQMASDPDGFLQRNDVTGDEARELVAALEALTRPALVVDGQHRLLGAAMSDSEVLLPCVLMPNATWIDQVYQFVLINEAAKKVETSLLTDIFGNSLTPDEQTTVRERLRHSRVDVEGRIAATIADRDTDSPFASMVRFNIGGSGRSTQGFLNEATIRQLIDGGRNVSGWRTDDQFYQHCVSPTFPDREDWELMSTGAWRAYWYAFWAAVRDYYNDEAEKDRSFGRALWTPSKQENLTKAVSLRNFQRLFMNKAIERAKSAETIGAVLEGRMEKSQIDLIIREEKAKYAVANTPEEFAKSVREWFLAPGVPVRVFTKQWVTSLDDSTGADALYREFEKAFDLVSKGERYRAQNKEVFDVSDQEA